MTTINRLIHGIVLFFILCEIQCKHKHLRKNFKRKLKVDDASKRQGLPSFNMDELLGMISKETPKGKIYEAFGCSLTISANSCKFSFTPDQACKEKISLGKIFEMLMKQEKLQSLTKTFLPISIFQIEKFHLDKCVGDIKFSTSAKEPFDIVKDKVQVTKATLEVDLNYKQMSEKASFKKLGMNLQGEVKAGETSLPLLLTKKRDSDEGKFEIKTQKISVDNFKSMFSKKEIADEKPPEKVGMFSKAMVNEPLITGTRDIEGGWEFVLKGKLQEVAGIDSVSVFIVAQKPNEESTGVALVADIKNISPTKLLSALSGTDLNNIPLIKDITVNIALEIANKDMTVLKDVALNTLLAKYVANAKTITKGSKVKLDVPIKQILQKTGTVANLAHIPEKMYVQIFETEGQLSFKFPEDAKLDIFNIILALVPAVPDGLFTKVMKRPPKVKIARFDVNVKTMKVDLCITSVEPVTFGNEFVKLTTVEFQLKHEPKGQWDFQIIANTEIGKSRLDVEIKKTGNEYELTGKIADLTTADLIKHFGGEKMDTKLMDKVTFLNFGVKDVKFEAKFGSKLELRFTANPILFDWQGLFLEGFIMDTPNGRKMYFGLLMKNVRLDMIAKKLFNKDILQSTWLSEAAATILVSNTKLGEVDQASFQTPELKSIMKLKYGVFFSMEITVPEDCRKDSLCEVAKSKLEAGTKFRFEGEFTTSGIELKAIYEGNAITFGPKKNLVLKKVLFVVKIGLTTEIYIEGQMKIKDPPLSFIGRLAVGASGRVELALTMDGMWKRPFGIKYCAVGNIKVLVAVSPSVPVSKLELTGEMHVGKIGNGKEIKSKSAVAINFVNPVNNYFYSELSALTLKSLASAFEFDLPLPEPILDTGFPDGLLVAFTTNPKGVRIEHLDVNINTGIAFRGAVNLLGIKVKCEILVNLPDTIKVSAEFSPLNIAKGLMKIRRNVKDTENGPLVYVHFSKTEIEIKVEGYVELLGIGAGIVMDISNEGLKFQLYGNLFNLIEANITVAAPWATGKLLNSQYFISACVSASIGDVTTKTTETITEGANDAEKALQESESGDTEAAEWYDRALEKLNKWAAKKEERQAIITRKSGKLDKIRDVLDTKCVDSCEDKCIGGITEEKNCFKLFGKMRSCPGWDDCAHKVESPICLAKCKANQVYLHGKAAKKVVTIEIHIAAIEVLEKLVEIAMKFIKKVKEFVQLATKAVEKIKNAAEAGKNAIKAVADYTKKNLINIHHICFNTTLEEAQSACFGINLNVTLGGKKNFVFDKKACFDLSFVKNIADSISSHIFPGIDTIKEKLQKARNYFKDGKAKKEELDKIQADSKKEEAELEGKVTENDKDLAENNEDDDDEELDEKASEKMNKPGKREDVSSHAKFDKQYIRHQIYRAFPGVTIRDDITTDAIEMRSPWAMLANGKPLPGRIKNNSVPEDNNAQKEDIPIDIDALMEESNAKPNCKQTRATVDTYSSVAKVLNFLSSKIEFGKSKFIEEKQRFTRELDDVEANIQRNLKKINMSEEKKQDSLYYVGVTRKGNKIWEKNMARQLNEQDESSMEMIKTLFSEEIKAQKGISQQEFLNILKKATNRAQKRGEIPVNEKVKSSLETASQVVHQFFMNELKSFSSSKSAIDQLYENAHTLKQELPCAA